jgi:uncharacterized membrane protein (DUF373 family)
MENMDEIRRHYSFTPEDEENLKEMAPALVQLADAFGDDFYNYLLEDPYSASFFKTFEAMNRRKDTIKNWYRNLFHVPYNNVYLMGLRRVGQVHVRIGLKGHYVNAAMNFVRRFLNRQVDSLFAEHDRKAELLESLNKALDINLDVITSSYREAELKKVFLSYKAESVLVQWSERFLHGFNLILMIGLLAMSFGVVGLLGHDIYYALTTSLDNGIIKALGSLLILWMMIELLHTQVDVLRGGKFHVRVFLELALVAFIRKLFVASIEYKEPVTFGLFLGGILILGIILFLEGKTEVWRRS